MVEAPSPVLAAPVLESREASAQPRHPRGMIPKAALPLLPLLWAEVAAIWPDVPLRSALAAQVEQETCITLTHSKCWNPRAELKTDREYGFGLGQITVTSRFNTFSELRAGHRELSSWEWKDRYDPRLQLRALVLMDRSLFGAMTWASGVERMAFTFAGYNGGRGGVMSDRLVCKNTTGCDPARWFGHVERTSNKSRAKWNGYGKSAFEINREYVQNILNVRRRKYEEG